MLLVYNIFFDINLDTFSFAPPNEDNSLYRVIYDLIRIIAKTFIPDLFQ